MHNNPERPTTVHTFYNCRYVRTFAYIKHSCAIILYVPGLANCVCAVATVGWWYAPDTAGATEMNCPPAWWNCTPPALTVTGGCGPMWWGWCVELDEVIPPWDDVITFWLEILVQFDLLTDSSWLRLLWVCVRDCVYNKRIIMWNLYCPHTLICLDTC